MPDKTETYLPELPTQALWEAKWPEVLFRYTAVSPSGREPEALAQVQDQVSARVPV